MAFGASGGPRVDFRLIQPVVQLTFPVSAPQPDVRGFAVQDQPPPLTQPAASRAAAKLQTLYDGMPPEEQVVIAALLTQAARGADPTS